MPAVLGACSRGDFPAGKPLFHIVRSWIRDEAWESIKDRLRDRVRSGEGKRSQPTGTILDSQSVKSDPNGGAAASDAAKQIKGRKRHLLADTPGLLLAVSVTPSSTPEREGGQLRLGGVLL